jgi:hypothetical protein
VADDALPFDLRLTLRAGTVYYFVHRALYSEEPHYFVVVNAEPTSDTVVLLAVASSQIERIRARRANLPEETLVAVEPAQYGAFTKPTLIDCNQVFELPREELIAKFKEKELRHHPDLPGGIMDKVRAGILASPRVDDIHKELVREI